MQKDRSETLELPPRCVEKGWQRHAWLYDPIVKILFLPFGGESRFRKKLVDSAGLKEGEHVLDACCGTGTLTSLLAERVGKSGTVTGIDISYRLLEIASKKANKALPLSFRQASCIDIPFSDNHFDKIFISFGLHEIAEADRQKSLKEINRVLKFKGSLFIMEYNLPRMTLSRFIVKSFHRLFENEEAYRMLFNGTLLTGLEQAGISIRHKQLMGAGVFQILHANKALSIKARY
jgi:demethylmenaquinone methyltransferase/2-methoxy-6-polyprenyl-1,4-benzoquinol methylase